MALTAAEQRELDELEYEQLMLEQAQAPAAKPTSPSVPARQDEGAGMAGLQGYGQGATLGYLPQLQAAGGVAAQALGAPGDESYEDLLKYFQKRDLGLREAHPGATMAGNIGGGFAGAMIPGAVASRLAPMTMAAGASRLAGLARAIPGASLPGAAALGNIGKAAATGAGYGLAMNPEEGSRMENAATGAVFGGGLSGVGEFGKAAFPYIARATSGISPKAIKTYIKRQSAVDALIAEGKNAAASLSEETHNLIRMKYQNKKSEVGKALGQQINGSPNLINRDKIFAPIEEHITKLTNSEMSLTREGQEEIIALRGQIDSMKEGLPDLIKPETAWDLKDRLYRAGKITPLSSKAEKQVASSANQAYKVAGEELNNAAGSAGLNKQFSELAQLGDKLKQYFKNPAITEKTLLNLDAPSKGIVRKTVDEMDAALGKTPVKENAELLEAYSEFRSPEFLPGLGGGTTSTSRTLGLSSIAEAIGGFGNNEQGARVGRAVGSVLGGPLAVKSAIKTTNFLAPYTPSAGQLPYVFNPWIDMKKEGQ